MIYRFISGSDLFYPFFLKPLAVCSPQRGTPRRGLDAPEFAGQGRPPPRSIVDSSRILPMPSNPNFGSKITRCARLHPRDVPCQRWRMRRRRARRAVRVLPPSPPPPPPPPLSLPPPRLRPVEPARHARTRPCSARSAPSAAATCSCPCRCRA